MTESIAFITKDFSPGTNPPLPGGCAYYRCSLPRSVMPFHADFGLPAWTGAEGYGISTGPTTAMFGYDAVVLKLMMERNTVFQMKAAQGLGQKIIVDVDDWYEDLPESNQAFAASDPTKNKISNRDHYRDVILQADTLVVSTPFLHEQYSKMRSNVHLVRNSIDPNVMTVREVKNRKPVIGWVGGVPWRGGDLETLREWLPDFLEEHDLMFHHSGDMPDKQSLAELAGIDTRRVTTSKMLPLNEYFANSFCFDIGLVPLNDIPFNHAKSTIKGLEYAGSGIPFVAQGLPEYRRLSDMGVGRVAVTPADWRREVGALLDYKTRKRASAMNLAMLRRFHSIGALSADWVKAYSS